MKHPGKSNMNRLTLTLNKLSLFPACALALMLIGCGTAPVYNVIDAPVVTAGQIPTVDQMRAAIIRAGARRGWRMRQTGAQQLRGTLNVRDHTAQADIRFNWRNYSIRYHSSNNLNYDGVNIHSRYNNWIENLDKDIREELAKL